MRILIYTGKGGVGKTSTAAATGVKLAGRGQKTLVISTDLAHSLADSFGVALSHKPTPVIPNLWAEELNPQSELEERWEKIHGYLVHLFKVMGVGDVFAEEMTLLPGVEELFSLLEIYHHYREGQFDVIILDCPPTASTLRLLSLFDALGWYMERFFEIERKSTKFIKFFTDSFLQVPLPDDDVFQGIAEIYERMAKTKELLSDPDLTSIRLVMTPEQMVINESQRAFTYLNLYGFNVDAAIVNKVLPSDLKGEFFERWQKQQRDNLRAIKEVFTPMKIFTLPLQAVELQGLKRLQSIAQDLYAHVDPLQVFQIQNPLELIKEETGYHFKIYMPYLDKKKFDLHQKGVLLIVTVGSYKRKILLPQVLSNKNIRNARYADQSLHLYFEG